MKQCDLCGKKSQVQKSGAHNYGGGWAYRAHKTRWVGEPNLHSQRVTFQGVRKTMRLCTKCLRKVKAEMAKNVSKVSTAGGPLRSEASESRSNERKVSEAPKAESPVVVTA